MFIREIDDFSYGFSVVLDRIGEEDEEDYLRREEGGDDLGEMNMSGGWWGDVGEGLLGDYSRVVSLVYSWGSNGGGRLLW